MELPLTKQFEYARWSQAIDRIDKIEDLRDITKQLLHLHLSYQAVSTDLLMSKLIS